jgi:prepilin-type N-terminal cleavage/methylation domain-containing protein
MKSREAGLTLIELLVSITLFSLLAVAVLFGCASASTQWNGRRTASPATAESSESSASSRSRSPVHPCEGGLHDRRRSRSSASPSSKGEPNSMRFVSTYSLNEASRGYPRILEFTVVPG